MADRRIDCPTCGRSVRFDHGGEAPFLPFCSRRCRLVDLGKWLEGEYRISREMTGDDFLEEDHFNSDQIE